MISGQLAALEHGWDDLPEELLRAIVFVGGTKSLEGMRGVCKSWQAGFEGSVSHISTRNGPLLPLAPLVLARFPILRGVSLNCSSFQQFSRYDLRTSFLGLPLTKLELTCCDCLRVIGLDALRQMPLSALRISGGRYGAAKFVYPGSTSVGLRPGLLNPEEVLACLGGKHLNSLDLSYSFGVILVMPDGRHNSGINLDILRGMPLATLNLGRFFPYVHNSTLECLKDLPLTGLSLEKSKVTDAGLGLLRGLPLVELNLNECSYLTDAGLDHLLRMQQLQRVGLKSCLRISEEGLSSLQLRNPALEVLW